MSLSKAVLQEFLEKNKLAILSTVNEKGQPDAAPIYFVHDEAFNFSFISPEHTQKTINLKQRPEVVLTITNELKQETLQVRGLAQESKEDLMPLIKQLAEKLNQEENFVTSIPLLAYKNQNKTVFKIKPLHIRLRCYQEEKIKEEYLDLSEI